MQKTDQARLPEGQLKNVLLTVAGKHFRCSCGCNVFNKPDSQKPELYRCNACNMEYSAE